MADAESNPYTHWLQGSADNTTFIIQKIHSFSCCPNVIINGMSFNSQSISFGVINYMVSLPTAQTLINYTMLPLWQKAGSAEEEKRKMKKMLLRAVGRLVKSQEAREYIRFLFLMYRNVI